ncbi:hypothetical protein [Nitrococcus mobilis]|uniref:Uncharacterized protein n=1 Tax=Nitrococcus mobilis Nb-231 TaxID=314278 RepID=A4BQC5_9GAMM|nr:hypothetical protein [Nitrococcus mobilis]EAR22280.1 hypothetical protein NB231_05205 [Nitrococcus mobilis Nb-231]
MRKAGRFSVIWRAPSFKEQADSLGQGFLIVFGREVIMRIVCDDLFSQGALGKQGISGDIAP